MVCGGQQSLDETSASGYYTLNAFWFNITYVLRQVFVFQNKWRSLLRYHILEEAIAAQKCKISYASNLDSEYLPHLRWCFFNAELGFLEICRYLRFATLCIGFIRMKHQRAKYFSSVLVRGCKLWNMQWAYRFFLGLLGWPKIPPFQQVTRTLIFTF